MKVAIIDDQPQVDIENPRGTPQGATNALINNLKTDGYKVSLSGVSQNRRVRENFDFDFVPVVPTATFLAAEFHLLLVDFTLDGHDPTDNSGLAFARQCVDRGFPAWRIAFFSRHAGRSFAGQNHLRYSVFDKTKPGEIDDLKRWLISKLNTPSRKVAASAIIDKHLNYRTPIDNAFHGWPLGLSASSPCPIKEFFNDLKTMNVTVCPELDVLSGDPENSLVGFRSMLTGKAQAYLQTLYPSPTVEQATWNNLMTKLNLAVADLSAPPTGASLTLRDWAFPRTDSNDATGLCSMILKNAWARAKEQGLKIEAGNPNWVNGNLRANGEIKHALPFTCYLDFFDTNFLPNAANAGAMSWKIYTFTKSPSSDGPLPCFLVIECAGRSFASQDIFQNCASKLFERLRTYCHVLTSAKCSDGGVSVIELLPNTRVPRSIASQQVEYDGVNLNFAAAHSGDVTSTYVFILDGKP